MIKQWFEGLSKEYNSSAWNLWASRYNWENILVKDGKAIRYDPRTKEAYSVDLKRFWDLWLDNADDYYSIIEGKKYRLPLYWDWEVQLWIDEINLLYNN